MSSVLFNAAFGLYVIGLLTSGLAFITKKDLFFKAAIVWVGVAFALHSGFLIYSGVQKGHLPLTDMRESLAFFAWTVSACFFLSYGRYRIKELGIFVLPLVAALMLGTTLVKASPASDLPRSAWIFWHSVFLFLGYAMLFVTFVAGILYLFQEKELKNRQPKTFYYRLPSLDLLDDLFVKFLISGFAFMTMGLLAGILWAEQEVSGWLRDPTVIAAIITWGIYLILIYFRLTAGWRGRRAAVISMLGFISVLLIFLGASFLGGLHNF
ncbi:MAG: cytochrome C assembly family protein [Acidobacteriota bacterium]